MTITVAQVELITRNAPLWYVPLRDAMALRAIDTDARAAAFLAQVSHESLRFTRLEEGLSYSAARLLEVFKYRDAAGVVHCRFTPAEALAYAYDPARIANRVYAGRMGNGSESSGDGFRYRGRGLIQLTGKDNYQRAGGVLGIDLLALPERAKEPFNAALIAAWFWDIHRCNDLADHGDFEEITRRINGGMNGINERLAELDRVQRVLTA